jgi:hypothetical protein
VENSSFGDLGHRMNKLHQIAWRCTFYVFVSKHYFKKLHQIVRG